MTHFVLCDPAEGFPQLVGGGLVFSNFHLGNVSAIIVNQKRRTLTKRLINASKVIAPYSNTS